MCLAFSMFNEISQWKLRKLDNYAIQVYWCDVCVRVCGVCVCVCVMYTVGTSPMIYHNLNIRRDHVIVQAACVGQSLYMAK